MFSSPHRKFSPASVSDSGPEGARRHEVTSARYPDLGVVLDEGDYRLARLFDGQRSPEEIRLLAEQRQGRRLSAQQIEGFAEQLSIAGVLSAGYLEPLPVAAQSDEEIVALGWAGGVATLPGSVYSGALPPSTLPGARGTPAYLGGLTGLIGSKRGQQALFSRTLRPEPLVALGRWLIWPVASLWHLAVFALLVAGALLALHQHRHEWWRNGADLVQSYVPLLALVGSCYLVNFISSAARAAAVARYTPERPRAGIITEYGPFRVPRLFVDSSGAAERARLGDRLRIIGAGMAATLLLSVFAILLWFLTAATQPAIAAACVAIAVAGMTSVFIRGNPIVERDGYYLMASALGAPDLRVQAIYALWGQDRAWFNQSRRLSPRLLVTYVGLIAAYWSGVFALIVNFGGKWVTDHFGGLGFLFLIGFAGVSMSRQYYKVTSQRSEMGRMQKSWWPPSTRAKWIAGGIALLCVFPYPYTPSGDFTVLPKNRADVRALVPGAVREVLVKEGDTVKAGQVIAMIEDDEAKARVATSRAELAQLQADFSLLQKGARPEEIDVARQRVNTVRRRAEFSRAQAERLDQAYKRKAVTYQEYDRARGVAEVDQQELLEAQRSLDLISSPARSDRIDAIQAQIDRAKAELALHEKQLNDTKISAPIAGRVVSGSLIFAVGSYLARGDKLAVIEDTSQLMAEIQLPESAVGDVEVGNSARFKVWAYPGSSFRGTVESIAPAAEQGPYGKVVRVRMEVSDPDGQLKSGMTGNAKVSGGWHMMLTVFTRALARFLFVEVWSWLP